MFFGSREDNSEDADELEDGTQEQAIAQQALQKGGFRDLRGGQVQISRHGATDSVCSPATCAGNQGILGRNESNVAMHVKVRLFKNNIYLHC